MGNPLWGKTLKKRMKFPNEAVAAVFRRFRGRLAALGGRVLRRGANGVRALVERSDRTAAVAVTVLIAVSAAAVGVSGLDALGEQGRLRDTLAAEVAALEQEAGELCTSISALREDPAAFELLAKTRHHLVEPGEIVVLLHQPTEPAPAPSAPGRGPR